MTLIQVPSYREALNRRLSIDGDGGPRELGPEIHPTFDMEPGPVDWQFLQGVRRVAGFAAQAAVGAQLQSILLINAAGSGVIAVVEEIVLSVPTASADVFNIGRGSVITGGGTASVLDTRWRSSAGVDGSTLTTLARSNAASVLASGWLSLDLAAQAVFTWKDPGIILTPGFSVAIEHANVNLAIRASFRWRERALQPFEVVTS